MDNGQPFDNKSLRDLCDELGIKKKLNASKGAWVDELLYIAKETPFSMAYGAEATSPIDVGLPSPRLLHFNEISYDEIKRCGFDFLEEKTYDL